MIDLTGKVAIVTGGSRGIGRAVALRLGQQGANIAFLDRLACTVEDHTREDVEKLGRLAVCIAGDVTDPAACTALVEATLEEFGRVDILVNNAGITRDDLIMRMSDEAWDDVLDINLTGAFNCPGRHAPDDQGSLGADHQHVQRVRPDRQRRPGQLLRLEGRPDRPHQGDRPRGRLARDHRQRRRARVRHHRADRRPARQRQGRHQGRRRWAASAPSTRSPTPSPSSPPTRPPTSPARSWPSTAAW